MVNNIRIITQKGGLLEQNLSGLFLLSSCLFKSPHLGLTVYLKFAHLINNKEYFWIKLSILFFVFLSSKICGGSFCFLMKVCIYTSNLLSHHCVLCILPLLLKQTN